MSLSRSLVVLSALVGTALGGQSLAANPPAPKPLKVLLVCGGCCHDYTKQKVLIAEGLAARAHIEVTAVQQGGTRTDSKIPLYEKDDWYKGYDLVIHDECFSDVPDSKYIARILAPHRAGLPGVVLHCAMHSYRDGTDEWFKFCGVTSRRHGASYGHEVLNNDPAHPIMSEFGPAWANPAGELYWIEKVWPTAHPLATAKNRELGKDEVCVWTNQYEKARIFGTTLGHHNETVGAKAYLDMLTRGVLWAAGKLEPDYLKTAGAMEPRTVPMNLAIGKSGKASSEQSSENHFIKAAFDGNPATRWCPSGSALNEWIQVDLGSPTKINSARIDWESSAAYKFRLEGSIDGSSWKPLFDASKNESQSPNLVAFKPTNTRYLRVTFLGTNTGGWGSINEFEVFGDQTIVIDPKADAAAKDSAYFQGVKIPDGFEATVFAAPPAVNYPVFVAASPNGDVYVSSDRNGSLDREKVRGSVFRLRDLNGDGKADEVKRFVPNVDSPRGLVFDRDRLYLMHPPHFSAFIDKDGDGIADEQKILVKNIAFGFKDRPADHTSNGVTMGIDGWLYLAIGDFGFLEAEGTDGRKLQLRGGGVVRVRPDGTGLELYSRGTRNILEASVDPLLNAFSRDNTNDGGGWDIRLHHFSGMEDHGYPRIFKNFTDEAVAPLADYGGGSGCGSLYVSEPGFPQGFGDALYTADWGRDRVFKHTMTPNGATFKADQNEFLSVPRVTDLDVDALGHLYVSSWKGATFTFAGEEVGYILRVTPKGTKASALPQYEKLSTTELVKELESPSHRRRIEAQRTLLAKTLDEPSIEALTQIASNAKSSLASRVAAIFTLKQGLGSKANALLSKLATDETIREHSLRALTDRADAIEGVPSSLISSAMHDKNPRVRRQAAVSAARLSDVSLGKDLVALLNDEDLIVAHTAIQALISLRASDACFNVVDSPQAPTASRKGALRVLQAIHDSNVVDGLIGRLGTEKDPKRRLGLIEALARVDHREGFWRGDSWGTRPDTSGPYYQPETWEASKKIEAALNSSVDSAIAKDLSPILTLLDRNKVSFPGLSESIVNRAWTDPNLVPAAVEHLSRLRFVPGIATEFLRKVAAPAKGRPIELRSLAAQALLNSEGEAGLKAVLEVMSELQQTAGDTSDYRKARDAFFASSRLGANRKFLEGIAAAKSGQESVWAEAALLSLSTPRRNGGNRRDPSTDHADKIWANPDRRVQLLRAIALAGHQPSASRVVTASADHDPSIASAAKDAAKSLGLDLTPGAKLPTGPKIETLALDRVLASVSSTHGDKSEGERLFTRLNCVNCHTVRPTDAPKGPFLGTIATTYKRRELAEAILVPSKTIAQGFTTNIFALEDGRTLTGFVVKEASDAVTVRDADAKEFAIATSNIVERAKSNTSVMPEGLVKSITVGELASLVDYLESLSSKAPAKP
jgi:putative membrane-bound dehydrogenase-like protein